MIAVIFELWPNAKQQSTYFDLAAQLRSELDGVDGFVSIERFESLATQGKYLRKRRLNPFPSTHKRCQHFNVSHCRI
jgi:hypothetical protein